MKKKKKETKRQKAELLAASSASSQSKEEISEIFKIEKNGKEKTIEAHGIGEEKAPSKEQIKKEKKIFIGIVVVMIGSALMFLVVYKIIDYTNNFEVEGVKFEVIKMGSLTLYKTSLPLIYQGGKADYNFYLRTDPRLLKSVELSGGLSIRENMVINMSNDFNCNGDGVIAIANLLNLYRIMGTEVIKDENASCDELFGRYVFLNIKEGDETGIVEYGLKGACYNLNVNNCGILKATEKFMLETLIEANKKIEEDK